MLRDAHHHIIEVKVAREGVVFLKEVCKRLISRLIERTIVDNPATTDGHIVSPVNRHHIISAFAVDSCCVKGGGYVGHFKCGTHIMTCCARTLSQYLHTFCDIGIAVQYLDGGDIRVSNLHTNG